MQKNKHHKRGKIKCKYLNMIKIFYMKMQLNILMLVSNNFKNKI